MTHTELPNSLFFLLIGNFYLGLSFLAPTTSKTVMLFIIAIIWLISGMMIFTIEYINNTRS